MRLTVKHIFGKQNIIHYWQWSITWLHWNSNLWVHVKVNSDFKSTWQAGLAYMFYQQHKKYILLNVFEILLWRICANKYSCIYMSLASGTIVKLQKNIHVKFLYLSKKYCQGLCKSYYPTFTARSESQINSEFHLKKKKKGGEGTTSRSKWFEFGRGQSAGEGHRCGSLAIPTQPPLAAAEGWCSRP